MKNTTVGIETSAEKETSNLSASSIPQAYENLPATDPLALPENFGIVCQVVNGIVTPNLQILLASVLGAIDASIPNKEQNKAVKHILRKQFDHAYGDILRRSYPGCGITTGPSYMLEPNADAFTCGTIRK